MLKLSPDSTTYSIKLIVSAARAAATVIIIAGVIARDTARWSVSSAGERY
jgi:hypothetical protein